MASYRKEQSNRLLISAAGICAYEGSNHVTTNEKLTDGVKVYELISVSHIYKVVEYRK